MFCWWGFLTNRLEALTSAGRRRTDEFPRQAIFQPHLQRLQLRSREGLGASERVTEVVLERNGVVVGSVRGKLPGGNLGGGTRDILRI